MRSISEVTKAVACGDFSKFVNVNVQGEMLDLKMSVNSMVAQLLTLAQEIIRMSIEVGTEGKLSEQVVVEDVQGMWKVSIHFLSCYCDSFAQSTTSQILTDNVNLMAMNLTDQVCSITEVTKAIADSDLTKKITVDVRGEILDLKETVNGTTESLRIFVDKVTRLAREVGTEGKLGG